MQQLESLVRDESSLVRFVAGITGTFDALVAVQAPDFFELERTVKDEIRSAGGQSTETAVALLWIGPPLPMPKWKPARPYEAFVQCRVDPGRAQDVAQGLSRLQGALGVAMVAGSFDLLFELGADSFEELSRALMQMHEVEGLRWTRTSLAAFPADPSTA